MSPALKNLKNSILNFLLPPLCLMCAEPVGSASTLCPDCWKKIKFIASPFCARCGMPFDFPVSEGTLCGVCLAEEPPYETARAAMLYDEDSRKLVIGFKNDRTYAAPALAAWMHRAGSAALAESDALVPVPLHPRRLFQRRYNQSALLALEIGKLTGKPVLLQTLRRIRDTESQGHMKRKERRENVRGAFALRKRDKALVAGKTITLIDDVMTTGATVEECARALLKSGALRVHILTLSRVKTNV